MLASLNDIPLTGIDRPSFTKVDGLGYDEAAITILQSQFSRLKDAAAPLGIKGGQFVVTLTIGYRTIRDLRLISVATPIARGSATPFITLRLVDRRYFWPRKLLSATYNIKRRVGITTARTTIERRPEGAEELLEEYGYREQTLRNGKVVTIREAFIEQMAELGEVLGSTYQLPSDFGSAFIRPLETVVSGADMLGEILDQVPDYSLYMDDEGVIQIFKLFDLDNTRKTITSIKPVLEEGTSLTTVSRAYDRPEYIDIYFDVEAELLARHRESFDEEDISLAKRTLADYAFNAVDGIPVPYVECVARNPLRDLTISGQVVSDENAFVRLSNFFQAVSTIALPPYNVVGPPNYNMWRKIHLRDWEILAQFLGADLITDQQWQLIISAIRSGFRRQFRFVKPWWDLFRAVIPYRSSLVNEFDLTRANAPVFMDHTLWPSFRVFYQRNLGSNLRFGYEIDAQPDNPDARIASPARVNILDAATGVFEINLIQETHGEYIRVVPGRLATPAAVVADTGNLFTRLRIGYPLTNDFIMTCIMTFLPYPKSNKKHMFKVRIRPSDAEKRLGQPIGECFGPPMEVKIPYSEVTAARITWNDDRVRECIEPFTVADAEFDPNLLSNPVMLIDIANATCATIYSTMLDHIEGALATTGAKSAVPKFVGNFRALTGTVSPTGVFFDILIARGEFPIKAAEGFMSNETRAALMRIKLI